MTSHQIDISEYEKDPRLFLFTSLTAGSSHIITATSRMETILKANKIPFQAIDLATDEKARRLWQRRARERKLPGLVKEGFVLGDLDEIEEWNEFGELKENIGNVPLHNDAASYTVKTGVNIAPPIPVNPTATHGTTNTSQPPVNKAPKPGVDESKFRPLPGAAEIAARKKPTPEQKDGKSVIDENVAPKAAETMTSAPAEKEESINAAKKLLVEEQTRGVDHLSAPPSAMQSGTATPNAEPVISTEKPTSGAGEEKETLPPGGKEEAERLPSSEGLEAEKPTPSEGQEAEKTTSGAGEDAETLAPSGEEEAQKLAHRGSEVKAVPDEEIKTIESENSLAEAAEEEADEEGASAMEATDAGEGKAGEEVHEQSAKEGEDAGKSVGD